MGAKKVTLNLTDEARAIIEAQATPRKQGEFVSGIVVGWQAAQDDASATTGGILERIEARLVRIEVSIEGLSTGGSK